MAHSYPPSQENLEQPSPSVGQPGAHLGQPGGSAGDGKPRMQMRSRWDGVAISAMTVVLSERTFRAARLEYPGDAEFEKLREGRPDSFLYRLKNRATTEAMLAVPLTREAESAWGGIADLPCGDYGQAIAALVKSRLPQLIPQWNLRYGHFSVKRIVEDDDLVAKAFTRMGTPVPSALRGFHKFLRIAFQPRLLQFRNTRPFIALGIDPSRRHEIRLDAKAVHDAGIDITGLWLIERGDEGDLLGPVLSLGQGGQAVVKTGDGPRAVTLEHCNVEPSTETFTRVFRQILGPRYKRYETSEWQERAAQASGAGYTGLLKKIASELTQFGDMNLASGLSMRFQRVLQPGKDSPRSVRLTGQTLYCFSPDRAETAQTPAMGLDDFGPFDKLTFNRKIPEFLVVCPAALRGRADVFIRRLRDGMAKEVKPTFVERQDGTVYEKRGPFMRGLVGTYRLADAKFETRCVDLNGIALAKVGASYVAAVSDYLQEHPPPDLVIVIVGDDEAFSAGTANPYLMTKAYLLSQGISTQEVRESTIAQADSSMPYILQNIAVAIYAKLGGSPWTIVPSMPLAHEIVMGLADAEVGPRQKGRRRYVGITTVFSADGNYLLSSTSPRCRFEEYPQRLTETVAATLSRLRVEQRWRERDTVRLIIHARRPLRGVYIQDVVNAALRSLPSGAEFDPAFLTITHDHPFKAVDLQAEGKRLYGERADGLFGWRRVAEKVPARGLAIDLGDYRQLICVSGSVQAKREGEPIPNPLLIELHRDSRHRDIVSLTNQVFHFTGLSWRSMLPGSEPVTIAYSRIIADLLNKLEGIPYWDEQLLNARLASKRWFL